jgi:hypothetical protein
VTRGRALLLVLVAGGVAAACLAVIGAADRPRDVKFLAGPTAMALVLAYHGAVTLVFGHHADELDRAEDPLSRWTLAAIWAPFLVLLAIVAGKVMRSWW